MGNRNSRRGVHVALLFVAGLVLAGCEIEGENLEDTQVDGGSNTGGGGSTGGGGGSTGGGGGGGSTPAPVAVQAPGAVNQEATGAQTMVALGTPQATGGDGSYTFANDAPAGNMFPLGNTTVTWTATDGAGANGSATQVVTVTDTTAPTISGLVNVQTPSTGMLTPITLQVPAVADLVDPNPTMSNDAPAAGYPMGMTVVTWTATDTSGNAATAQQTVTVTAPNAGPLTLTAPANVTSEATAQLSNPALGMATASGGQGQLNITNNAPAGGFPVGTTTVVWTVTDAANAMQTANQTVTITDTTAPTITAPANVTVDQNGNPTPVTLGNPTVNDLADPAPTVTNNAPAGGFPVGSTNVTWTATDASGNQATAIQTVTVNMAAPPPTCSSLQPEFAATVYPVLNDPANCGSCHTPPNIVSTANGFNILANDAAGFELFRAISNIRINGESSMTVKALGGGAHGGGNRFAAQGAFDPDYIVIEEFVAKVTTCTEDPPTSTATIDNGTGYEQLYKTTMSLGSRPPSPAETNAMAAQTDESGIAMMLDTTVEQLMTEESFYVRLMEIYNDVMLTDRDARDTGNVDDRFDLDAFSRRDYFEGFSGGTRNDLREDTNYGFARAPLELVRYVVENDLPFTEILTADYMMVNPYSATILGVDAGDPSFPFSSDQVRANHDRDDFRRVDSIMQDARASAPLPLAGVVGTHAWLARYESSNTNVNRHRASMFFYDFLGVDIEGLAARDGLDLDNVIGDVPTYEDPQCTVCHNVMDPIAGLFKNRENRGEYRGDVRWHHTRTTNGVPRMLAPGMSMDPADELPAGRYDSALQWLMEQTASDDRFAKQTVRTMFEALTRIDSTAPSTTTFLTALKDDFVADGFDLKNLIKAIVLSDYFLAQNLDPAEDPAQFADFGSARLLTPEELDRRITSLIGNGYEWEGPNTNSGLAVGGRYALTYGGIDSDDVTVRTTNPNSLIDGTQERIAAQIACERVALELNGGAGNLFPSVGITDTPSSDEAAIRANIQHLHRHLLGEDLATDSAEVDATYQLFVDVRAAGETSITNDCRGGGGGTDSNGTVIPWMAVVTYLLSDFRFFYE
ncbi:MAG: HYR domain-containing protein [Pseudomonadota bacterium]